ncbi:DNA-binding Xre family transcriptional regulator [Georgenia soli]|uniref:DNA-binding Xre family transcriptional regulator n=1 Tax=Georgenia soli TaxID=638953 RepID=A0A2A9F2A5_9MICO|nr:DNA-binding Xre family transcriptional regulator [Georgenia soli]
MTPTEPATDDDASAIEVHLDELLQARGMTLTALAARVDITIANLSILKNGRARAVRFSTLAAICRELNCQPGDLLSYRRAGDRVNAADAEQKAVRAQARHDGDSHAPHL